MNLPGEFLFSQTNLQDFIECKRRFYLRYIQRQKWPAVDTEPFLETEALLERGLLFHQLVFQYFIGIPEPILSSYVNESSLERWWGNFLSFVRKDLYSGFFEQAKLFPEVTLVTNLSGYRLVAKFDLVVVGADGEAVIYDWKTSTRRMRRDAIAGRMQTRVYPYLLMRASQSHDKLALIEADKLKMVYWYAEHPREPEIFTYSLDQFSVDEEYLMGTFSLIDSMDVDEFEHTSDKSKCRFCRYRSLCDLGVVAGTVGDELLVDLDDRSAGSFDVDFDFDQVMEIKF